MKAKVDLDGTVHTVEIPDGYRRVWRGAVLLGDLYLNCVLAADGIYQWEPMDAESCQPRRGNYYTHADGYACVVRRGESSPDKPCERCECRPVRFGCRYCIGCIYRVVKSQGKAVQS